MFRIYSLLTMFMLSFEVLANGTDYSEIIVREKPDGSWDLQLRSSLTTLKTEVDAQYSCSHCSSPEEFKQRLLEHTSKTLTVLVNEDQPIKLGDGEVKLGEQTTVLFNNLILPDTTKSISVLSYVTKDLYEHKTKLTICDKCLNKQVYVLSKANSFHETALVS